MAGGGLDVLLAVDRDAGRPLAAQLRSQIRDAVRTGRLAAGTTLPPSRTLARDLGLSRGVVVEAYSQLVAEGFLVAARGSRTAVAPGAAMPARPERARPGPVSAPLLDLRPGAPDLGTFPRSAWAAAVRHSLQRVPDSELGYLAPWGATALRDQLAAYLRRVRGAMASADDVVVVAGVTQGLTLCARALVADGQEELAVEDPSNAVQRGVLGRYGLRIRDVRVDGSGIDVAALARTGARAVVVTPAHQYPTGVALSPGRRAALLRWARDVDGLVIEDDYDAEFRYDRQPVGCLQGLDPSRVALVGSVSKSLAPGLRLGWLVPPPALLRSVAEAKRDDDFGTNVIEQHALARLLDSGFYDRHLRRLRRRYRGRRDRLVAELSRQLPGCRVTGLAAGLHLLLELPAEVDEALVVEAAMRVGLGVLGASAMRGGPGPPALVVGYARLSESVAADAISRLSTAVAAATRSGTAGGTARTGRRSFPGSAPPLSGGTAIDFYDLLPHPAGGPGPR
ncbi:MAG: PLP-dependent aminotransferase family protein [Mycobacteriales bacterium]